MAKMVKLFIKMTDCRMQIAKLALDSIAGPPFNSFQHVFEHGVSLNQYYFDRLQSTFPKQNPLWATNMPRRILELVAASRIPLTSPELKFAALSLLPHVGELAFQHALDKLSSFFAAQTGRPPVIAFQHKTVAEWVTTDEQPLIQYREYQFDALRQAYKGLASLYLVLVHQQKLVGAQAKSLSDKFRKLLAKELLMHNEEHSKLFVLLVAPKRTVHEKILDSLLFYLGEEGVVDAESRQRLLTESGALDALRDAASDAKDASLASMTYARKAIEWGYATMLSCIIQDLHVDVHSLLPPDQAHMPLTLAARLGKLEIVKLLVDLRADAAAADASGKAAVHLAVAHNELEVAEVLLAEVVCKCRPCMIPLLSVLILCALRSHTLFR